MLCIKIKKENCLVTAQLLEGRWAWKTQGSYNILAENNQQKNFSVDIVEEEKSLTRLKSLMTW